jgi:hypothetical protein
LRIHPRSVTARFSEAEFREVKAQAMMQGQNLAEWVRWRCLQDDNHDRYLGELMATQQMLAELVREFIVYSTGDHQEAVTKVRNIFGKAEAARNGSGTER